MNDTEARLRNEVIEAMSEAWVAIAKKEAPDERRAECVLAAHNHAVVMGGKAFSLNDILAFHQTHERMVAFFTQCARSNAELMKAITGRSPPSN